MIGRSSYWATAVLAGTGAWVAFPPVGARVVILIIAAVVVGDSLRNFNLSWGAPVTAQTQPALYAVVEGVAGRLGVDKPHRVWLTPFGPAVRLFPDGRRPMLRFHLAVVSCLTRAQLEALIAHELAALRYPRRRLVLRLRAACLEELDE
jgi:Zn-dependent protease with chaperone function